MEYNLGKVLLTPKGNYNGSTAYEILDVVTYNGSSYVAKQSTTGNAPTDGQTNTYWQLLAYGIEGGATSSTDVRINGVSITNNDIANILTEGTYDGTSNKIATMSEIPQPEVFLATYGTTTAAEIENALSANKVVIVKETNNYYLYASKNTNYYYFSRISGDVLTSISLKISDSSYAKNPNGNAIQFVNRITSTISGNETNTTKYPNTKAVYDAIHPAIATTEPSGGMLPNVLYEFGELSGNTTFTLATPSDNTIANHYYWTFDTPSTAPTITWPQAITSWFGGSAPTISASKHYEVSVLNGIAIAMEV